MFSSVYRTHILELISRQIKQKDHFWPIKFKTLNEKLLGEITTYQETSSLCFPFLSNRNKWQYEKAERAVHYFIAIATTCFPHSCRLLANARVTKNCSSPAQSNYCVLFLISRKTCKQGPVIRKTWSFFTLLHSYCQTPVKIISKTRTKKKPKL